MGIKKWKLEAGVSGRESSVHRGVHSGAGNFTGLVSQDCALKELDSDFGEAAGCCLSALQAKGLSGDTSGSGLPELLNIFYHSVDMSLSFTCSIRLTHWLLTTTPMIFYMNFPLLLVPVFGAAGLA